MRFLQILLCALLLTIAGQGAAYAVQPNEMLADPVQEQRARVLGKDLRCLVCQNQSIDDSDADLAHDIRVLLRQRIVAGDSDAQAEQYLVDRYGDYVLLTPPFKMTTLVLWLGPFLFLLLAAIFAIPFYRGRAVQKELEPSLSEEEKHRLGKLTDLSPETTPEKVEKL